LINLDVFPDLVDNFSVDFSSNFVVFVSFSAVENGELLRFVRILKTEA